MDTFFLHDEIGNRTRLSGSGSTKAAVRLAAADDPDLEGDIGVIEALDDPELKRPPMFKVILLNDDYTPMEFVVYVLQRFFGMSNSQATAIMLNVHQRGVGVCGIYSYEVAEAKATQVMDYARQNEHPLQLQIEKE